MKEKGPQRIKKKYSQDELSAFYIMSIPSVKRKNFIFENVGY